MMGRKPSWKVIQKKIEPTNIEIPSIFESKIVRYGKTAMIRCPSVLVGKNVKVEVI